MLKNLSDGVSRARLGSHAAAGAHYYGLWGQHPYTANLVADCLQWELDSLENVTAPLNHWNAFGREGDEEDSLIVYEGIEPGLDSYVRSKLSSYMEYSTYVGNIAHMFRDWNFKGTAPLVLGEEKSIDHLNLFGTVSPYGDFNLYRKPVVGQYENYPSGAYTHGRFKLYNVEEGHTSESLEVYQLCDGPYYPYPNGSLRANLGRIKSSVTAGGYDYITNVSGYKFKAFTYGLGTELDVSYVMYDFIFEYLLYPFAIPVARCITRVMHKFTIDPNPHYAEVGPWLNIADFISVKRQTFVSVLLTAQWTLGNEVESQHGYTAVQYFPTAQQMETSGDLARTIVCPVYFAHPTVSKTEIEQVMGYNGTTYVNDPAVPGSLAAFRRMAYPMLSDCFPANFLSSKEAVDKWFETMSTNHLETLVELGDILRVLDSVRLVKAILTSPAKALSFIMRLLNFITDAKIVYSFALSPSVADAKDVAEKASRLRDRFSGGDIFTPNTIYGKFTYRIPDEFVPVEFQGLRLVARSKLRISVDPDSFLSAVLPVRSLGLLPTLSSIWDCVPWSFLVDWFTHVGANQDDIETSAMMLCLNLNYSLHSISVIYDFDDEDCERGKFGIVRGVPTDSAGYKFYTRYVSTSIPYLGPTRFSFRGSASVPDWGLFGSLLYKLVT